MIPFTPPERPRFHDEWEALAAAAERLRADRAAADPRAVEAGKISQAEADRRARVAGAIAAQWRAIADRVPMPALEAGNPEILAELAAMREGWAARSRARRDDTQAAQTVALLDAMIWHQQPVRPGLDVAHIVFIHDCNQTVRAGRAERVPAQAGQSRTSNPGGAHAVAQKPHATPAPGESPKSPPGAASPNLFGAAA